MAFKGYPPVVGLDTAAPAVIVSGSDSRPPEPIGTTGTGYGVQWIPPVGFTQANDSAGAVPAPQVPQPLPQDLSVAVIVVTSPYRAEVGIYDYRNRLVRAFTQDFGYQGELQNASRKVPGGGTLSYLVWDSKDAAGAWAPTGVYLWRLRLRFENRQVEEKSMKVGLVGPECRAP